MINIYTMPMCSGCMELKEFCRQNNIEFKELDAKNDFRAKSKMISRGLESVPIVEYKGNFYDGDIDYLKNKVLEID